MSQLQSLSLNNIIKAFALDAGLCVAALTLVPDSVILTDEEKQKGVKLDLIESLKRKIFIIYVIRMGLKLPGNIISLANSFSTPGAKGHLLQASSALKLMPEFLLAYKALERHNEGKSQIAVPEAYLSGTAQTAIAGNLFVRGLLSGAASAL